MINRFRRHACNCVPKNFKNIKVMHQGDASRTVTRWTVITSYCKTKTYRYSGLQNTVPNTSMLTSEHEHGTMKNAYSRVGINFTHRDGILQTPVHINAMAQFKSWTLMPSGVYTVGPIHFISIY